MKNFLLNWKNHEYFKKMEKIHILGEKAIFDVWANMNLTEPEHFFY